MRLKTGALPKRLNRKRTANGPRSQRIRGFQGVVQIAEPTEADAGESAVGGFVETIVVFGGSGRFESEKGFSKAVREAFGGNQRSGEAREVVLLFVIHRGEDNVARFQFLSKGFEEFGETNGADLFENGWLSELG